MKRRALILNCVTVGLIVWACTHKIPEKTTLQRVADRDFPSIFQAWNPIDMPEYPLDTNADRLKAAAKHDMLWEEPVSQLGYGVKLVLGAVWDHAFGGAAKRFTPESEKLALQNRGEMLRLNPNMVFLMEIRWKDAPRSYLPLESEWWMRDSTGHRKEGWLGGPEPYYYLNYAHPGFQDQIQLQAQVAVESGVYDGIMLDWWGSHGEPDAACIAFLGRIRDVIGPDKLIIVNNDRIAPLPNSAPYLNGAFMENHSRFRKAPEVWDEILEQLKWFEANFQPPVTNCLNIQTGSPSEMRAGLTMSMVFSDGYYLFAEVDNSDPAPDHLHKWYGLYDVSMGKPVEKGVVREDGAVQRNYEKGVVVYNPHTNTKVMLGFPVEKRRASDGLNGSKFNLQAGDGDFFLDVE